MQKQNLRVQGYTCISLLNHQKITVNSLTSLVELAKKLCEVEYYVELLQARGVQFTNQLEHIVTDKGISN